MTRAFVLGNGISRQGVDLNQLHLLGAIYGCNALYREYTPDVLIATDRPIATHIQESGYSAQHRFHTRRPIAGLGAQAVPKPYFGFSSGPIATGLAAQDGYTHIYLVGFDMGPTANNTINNLYAGTEFYKKADAPPTFTGNWKRQIMQICRDYPQTQFIRVCGETTAAVAEFNSICNFKSQPLDQFLTEINQ
jgi:hypothetical protein